MIVLSHFQAHSLLRARKDGLATLTTTPDLNNSTVDVALSEAGITFPGGEIVTWEQLAEIDDDENGCFRLETDGTLTKIQMFSKSTNRQVSLYPTSGAPSMLLSGFPMHRVKDTDPWRDTLAKVKAARPQGRVLDTTMGLGYTAIVSARHASHVTTIEFDPAVVEIARQNPWSQDLFTLQNIERRVGDSAELISTFEDESFRVILHDPPTFKLAGDLYSGAFYRECFRVISRGGRLFHYIGDLDSQYAQRILNGIIRRLHDAGFTRVEKKYEAFAVVAYKR